MFSMPYACGGLSGPPKLYFRTLFVRTFLLVGSFCVLSVPYLWSYFCSMQQTIHWSSLKALKFVPIGEAALARPQLHPRRRRRKWRHPDQRPGYPDCLPIRDTDRGADQHLQELGGAEAGRGQEAAEPGLNQPFITNPILIQPKLAYPNLLIHSHLTNLS